MTAAITDAGFHLNTIDEPQPDPIARDLDPDAWRTLTTEPRFIFFVASRAHSTPCDGEAAKGA